MAGVLVEGGGVKVPYDSAAEANVVGCALARQRPQAWALGRDCYVPSHARLLAAARELYDVVPARCDPAEVDWAALYPFSYPSFERLRAAAAATMADVELSMALRLVDERYEPAVKRDVLVVAESRRKRNMMRVLADAYNTLGDGGDVDEVAELVSSIVA